MTAQLISSTPPPSHHPYITPHPPGCRVTAQLVSPPPPPSHHPSITPHPPGTRVTAQLTSPPAPAAGRWHLLEGLCLRARTRNIGSENKLVTSKLNIGINKLDACLYSYILVFIYFSTIRVQSILVGFFCVLKSCCQRHDMSNLTFV